MPIRMTGINSGMDTESIISELVKAKSVKKENLVKAQTKHQWKQDAWKELNAKVYGFYTKTLSNMRLTSDYSKKVTKVSDESVASIITGANAVDGVQTLEITKLAKSGYLTGGKVEDKEGRITKSDGNGVNSTTTLSDLGITGESSFTIRLGDGRTQEITLNAADTIGTVVQKLNDAGAGVKFDENRQRLVADTSQAGTTADFEILG